MVDIKRSDYTEQDLIKILEEIKKLNIQFTDKRIRLTKNQENELNKIKEKYPNAFSKNAEIYLLLKNPELIKTEFCKVCGKRTGFSHGNTIRPYCSLTCGNSSIESINKIKYSKLKKYGNENYNNREKAQQTSLLFYNTKIPSQSDTIKEKTKQTNLKKYGVEYYNNSELAVQTRLKNHIKNYDKLNKEYIRKNFIKDKYFLLEDFMKFYNLSYLYALRFKEKFEIKENPKVWLINTENEIYNYLNNYNIKIIQHYRKLIYPQELDLYCPEYKFAIEYDGLLFHSQGKNIFTKEIEYNHDKNYHLNKTELCEKQGIQLFHIFENEWKDPIKQNIWKSIISNKLHKNIKIYARKCIIKEVNKKEKDIFLNNNHLQGTCISSINLGLYYNNELVGLMTFGKPRFNSKYEYELLRFCNSCNKSIIGGASKLLNYFIKNYKPSSIISYANRRWSQGNLYEKLGFKKIKKSIPDYYWFIKKDCYKLFHRTYSWKNNIKKRNESFNESLTQDQNMFNNGYRKIYDCGNLVYEWRNNY